MAEPINRYLDHAVLKPEMTHAEAAEQMKIGVDYNVRTLCVRPADIERAKEIAEGTDTEVSCVLAFPHGDARSESKTDEAKRYIELGVAEIDMVVNYGFIRGGWWELLENDIRAVTDIANPAGVKVKTIFETAALTMEQIARATEVAVAARADFVKTSTGFGPGGATEEAVRTMLDAAAGRIGVKPAGGIRDRRRAEMFIAMGAARLGVGSTSTPIICDDTSGDFVAPC
ncbi:MAG: deoxyribose-phosphate aldolase [Phycisphaerae bacterium]|nr:deoxyribose-phosphate aldolase [Phycisphaerae bacterium]